MDKVEEIFYKIAGVQPPKPTPLKPMPQQKPMASAQNQQAPAKPTAQRQTPQTIPQQRPVTPPQQPVPQQRPATQQQTVPANPAPANPAQGQADFAQQSWDAMTPEQQRQIATMPPRVGAMPSVPGYTPTYDPRVMYSNQIAAWQKANPAPKPNPSGNIGAAPPPTPPQPVTAASVGGAAYDTLDKATHPLRTLTGMEAPDSDLVDNARAVSSTYKGVRNAARLAKNWGRGAGSVGDVAPGPGTVAGSVIGAVTVTVGGLADASLNAYERMSGKWTDPSAYWNAGKGFVVDNLDNAIVGATPGLREAALAQAAVDTSQLAYNGLNTALQ